jgi:hypothetical protein
MLLHIYIDILSIQKQQEQRATATSTATWTARATAAAISTAISQEKDCAEASNERDASNNLQKDTILDYTSSSTIIHTASGTQRGRKGTTKTIQTHTNTRKQ